MIERKIKGRRGVAAIHVKISPYENTIELNQIRTRKGVVRFIKMTLPLGKLEELIEEATEQVRQYDRRAALARDAYRNSRR